MGLFLPSRAFSAVSLAKRMQALQPAASATPTTIAGALAVMKQEQEHVYAKVIVSGRAVTIAAKDVVVTHRLKGAEVGDVVRLEKVFEIGTPSYVLRNAAFLNPAHHRILATVMSHARGETVHRKIVKRHKIPLPNKNIRPKISVLRIKEISLLDGAADR